MKKFLVIVSIFFLPLTTYSAPPVEVSNIPLPVRVSDAIETTVVQPTEFLTYGVSVSSTSYNVILPVDNERMYFYIQNPSDTYSLVITTSTNVSKNSGILLTPQQIFASDGKYILYGIMDDGSETTIIRVGVEK